MIANLDCESVNARGFVGVLTDARPLTGMLRFDYYWDAEL